MVKSILIVLKKSTTDAIKTASKRAIQKTAEATGDLIGTKIADKITSASKKPSNNNNNDGVELTTHKKDTYLQKKDSKLLMKSKSMYKLRCISSKER